MGIARRQRNAEPFNPLPARLHARRNQVSAALR